MNMYLVVILDGAYGDESFVVIAQDEAEAAGYALVESSDWNQEDYNEGQLRVDVEHIAHGNMVVDSIGTGVVAQQNYTWTNKRKQKETDNG